MSHVASVKAYVQDLQDARRVADRLGFDLVEGATTYEWYGKWVGDFRGGAAAVDNGHDPSTFGKCLHKLTRKDHRSGDYEIGLVARLDGKPGYELVYDNWGQGGRRIEELAGRNLTTLKNGLAEETTRRILMRQGYRMTRSVDATGAITLTATK